MVPQRTDLREETLGSPLLSFYCASKWHEDIPRSSWPVLLERDEETRWRFGSMVPHVSIGKG